MLELFTKLLFPEPDRASFILSSNKKRTVFIVKKHLFFQACAAKQVLCKIEARPNGLLSSPASGGLRSCRAVFGIPAANPGDEVRTRAC